AFMAAINIVNMLPTSTKLFGRTPDSIPTTPYKAFHGCQPTIKWIQHWGCDAWVYDKNCKSKKLGPRSNKMTFIGYEGMTNYRIWDPVIGKIIITPHVDFDENFDE